MIDLENDHNSSLSLKPSSNLGLLVNRFNNATPGNNNDPGKVCSSKCYVIEEMRQIEIPHKNKLLSLFHGQTADEFSLKLLFFLNCL